MLGWQQRGSRSGSQPDPPACTSISGIQEEVPLEEMNYLAGNGQTLNRLRTGVGRYKASMQRWGLADSAACDCGDPEQTAEHIINTCPLHRPPSEAGLFDLGPEMLAWLHDNELDL